MTGRSLGHRAPLLWLVLPMMGGLALGRAINIPRATPWLLGAALVAAGAALTVGRHRPRVWAALIVAAMVCAGAASYALHRPRIAAWDGLPPREARLTLRLDRMFGQTDARKASGLATITAAPPHLRELAGQRVYFSVALHAGEAAPLRSAVEDVIGVIETIPRDPPADSFDSYLAAAGMNFRLTRARVLAEVKAPTAYRRFCARMAERFARTLTLGVGTKRPQLAAVLRAMLLGQQHELTEEQDTLFRESGTMHIFSISGLHIAVIAGGLHALLALLRLPRLLRFGAAMAALWLYVDITGGAPSAVRAFTMVALVEASLVLRLPRNPLAALAAAALLAVVFAPLQVFGASFQMSYGIVAALLLVGLPLAEMATAAWGPFRDLPKATWAWHHHLRDWLWRSTAGALAIGLAAALVSSVSGILFFNLFTPGALLANLLFIPAATLVILAGFVSLLCGLVGFAAGSVLMNHAAVVVLWGIEVAVRALVRIPGMWFPAAFTAPWLGMLALALLLATMIAGYARGWSRGFWPPLAVVALALGLAVSWTNRP